MDLKSKQLDDLLDRIGLSQVEIAKAIKVPATYITRWKTSQKISKQNWNKLNELAEEVSRKNTETNFSQMDLKHLVEAIESLGWEVTLKRKDRND